MDGLVWGAISFFGIALMLVQLALASDPVELTFDFCAQGIHKVELNDGESKYFIWNGKRISKFDFNDCDLWLSGLDRKTSDHEEWTVCIAVEEFKLTDCDVKITYELIKLDFSKDKKIFTYNCTTPPPDNYCTKNIILKMGVTAMKDSASHFKVKMSATQHATTEDVMFIVKIVAGVIGVLIALCGSGCLICCCCCKDDKSSTSTTTNKKEETGEPELQNIALTEKP